jgi:hypothetical protein
LGANKSSNKNEIYIIKVDLLTQTSIEYNIFVINFPIIDDLDY